MLFFRLKISWHVYGLTLRILFSKFSKLLYQTWSLHYKTCFYFRKYWKVRTRRTPYLVSIIQKIFPEGCNHYVHLWGQDKSAQSTKQVQLSAQPLSQNYDHFKNQRFQSYQSSTPFQYSLIIVESWNSFEEFFALTSVKRRWYGPSPTYDLHFYHYQSWEYRFSKD